jgi:hypothetical protein
LLLLLLLWSRLLLNRKDRLVQDRRAVGAHHRLKSYQSRLAVLRGRLLLVGPSRHTRGGVECYNGTVQNTKTRCGRCGRRCRLLVQRRLLGLLLVDWRMTWLRKDAHTKR